MNTLPLLTLGLPVYNGEECIALTIQSIVNAIHNLMDKSKIEILVSDNNSTDKTSEVVKKFIEDGYEIKYYCNETNIGYDGNIDAIVERANGKYVWFLGCGEKVKIDSLSRLIEKLNNDIEYTNILLDYDTYDESKNKIITNGIYDFRNDILMKGKNDFRYKRYDPAISSNIINREVWLNNINEPLAVAGWCHIERILGMIASTDNNQTLLLSNPYYSWYKEINGWWTKPNSYLFTISLIKVIKSMSAKGFDEIVVNNEIKRYSKMNLVGTVISYKSYGHIVSGEMITSFKEIFKSDYFFWVFVLPLLLLPNKLIFIPKIILKIFNLTKRVVKSVQKIIS